MKMCSIPGCGGVSRARDLCLRHYRQWQRTGDPVPKVAYGKRLVCAAEGCTVKLSKKSGGKYCIRHYANLRWRGDVYADPIPKRCATEGCNQEISPTATHCRIHVYAEKLAKPAESRGPCSIPGCDKQATWKKMCSMHWSRWRRHGDPNVVLRSRDGSTPTTMEFTLKTNYSPATIAQYRSKVPRLKRELEVMRADPNTSPVAIAKHERAIVTYEKVLAAWEAKHPRSATKIPIKVKARLSELRNIAIHLHNALVEYEYGEGTRMAPQHVELMQRARETLFQEYP